MTVIFNAKKSNRTLNNSIYSSDLSCPRDTKGISTADLSIAVLATVAKVATLHDLIQPAHVFPVADREVVVLVCMPHDLAKSSGVDNPSVIADILNEGGIMPRYPQRRFLLFYFFNL